MCSPQGRVYIAWDLCVQEWTPFGGAFTHLRTAYTWRPHGLSWQSMCVTPAAKAHTEEMIYGMLLWDLAPLGKRYGANDEFDTPRVDTAAESDHNPRVFDLEPGTLQQALSEIETNVGSSAENAVPFRMLPAHERSTLISVSERQIELAWQRRASQLRGNNRTTMSQLAFRDGHLYALMHDHAYADFTNDFTKRKSKIIVWDIAELARPATFKIQAANLAAALAVGTDGTIYTAVLQSEIPQKHRCGDTGVGGWRAFGMLSCIA